MKLGYVRGNVCNHQDYDVYKYVNRSSNGGIKVAAVTSVNPFNGFNTNLVEHHHVKNFESTWWNEYDILDTSEFYRDYSQDILRNFYGLKSVTVFDNIPFLNGNYASYFSKDANVIIARTEMIRQALIIQGADKRKIQVVPSAVDTELFKPGPLTNYTPRVIFCGRLVPEKGLLDLILAMTDIDAELLVIGEGHIAPYQIVAKETNVKMNYVGAKSQSEIAQLMRTGCMLVVPSTPKIDIHNGGNNWVEQFGVVLLEGMASGLPIVASRTGSIESIVLEGENGFLFNPRDWMTMRFHIRTLLENYGLRNQLGASGRNRAIKKYSSEVVGKQLADIYGGI